MTDPLNRLTGKFFLYKGDVIYSLYNTPSKANALISTLVSDQHTFPKTRSPTFSSYYFITLAYLMSSEMEPTTLKTSPGATVHPDSLRLQKPESWKSAGESQ